MKSNSSELQNSVQSESEKNMKLIPAGKFLMGADGWGEFEKPVHEVYLDSYLIDETPVTNKQFSEFVNDTGYITTAEQIGEAKGYVGGQLVRVKGLNWKSYATPERENHPVVLISWHDANTCAISLGKRLPTEAEWEKAARGGLIQKLYPWGNSAPEPSLCNYGKVVGFYPPTTEIKSFPPNAFGLFDMCGNVWNWCNDWYSEDYYGGGDSYNPTGASFGRTKVRRGASFNIIQHFRLRCSNRGAYDPMSFAINIGFRCVKSLTHE